MFPPERAAALMRFVREDEVAEWSVVGVVYALSERCEQLEAARRAGRPCDYLCDIWSCDEHEAEAFMVLTGIYLEPNGSSDGDNHF